MSLPVTRGSGRIRWLTFRHLISETNLQKTLPRMRLQSLRRLSHLRRSIVNRPGNNYRVITLSAPSVESVLSSRMIRWSRNGWQRILIRRQTFKYERRERGKRWEAFAERDSGGNEEMKGQPFVLRPRRRVFTVTISISTFCKVDFRAIHWFIIDNRRNLNWFGTTFSGAIFQTCIIH